MAGPLGQAHLAILPEGGAVASAVSRSAHGILKGMEPRRWGEGPGHQVVGRGFSIASETNEACRPVHLLAALEEVQGPLSSVLRPASRRWLYPRAEPPSNLGGSMGYLGSQAVSAATTLADSRHEVFAPAHLLLAVLDQGDVEVLERLADAGIDPARARAVAAQVLGAPSDLAPVPMPELCPAGTHDRPPLPLDELDPSAWAVLSWRQGHLPLGRLKRRSDWYALSSLERRAAWRVLPSGGGSMTTSAIRCCAITMTVSRPWLMKLALTWSRPASSSGSAPSAECPASFTSSAQGPGGQRSRTSWSVGRRGSPTVAPACGTSASDWSRLRRTGANRAFPVLAEPCHLARDRRHRQGVFQIDQICVVKNRLSFNGNPPRATAPGAGPPEPGRYRTCIPPLQEGHRTAGCGSPARRCREPWGSPRVLK